LGRSEVALVSELPSASALASELASALVSE
jgi:hypothetical protein